MNNVKMVDEPLGEIEQAVEYEIERLAKKTVEEIRKKGGPGPRLRASRRTRNQKKKIAALSKRRNRANR